MKGIHRSMNTLPTGFVCRHAMLCFHVLSAIAFAFGAVPCWGDEMATEIATPLQEFKVKRLEIVKKAEADTLRELQTLIRKLEKVSKGKNKNPKANEQATRLLEKIKAPTFLAVGLDQLMDETHVGVSLQGAEMIALAYKQRRVTAEDWKALPGEPIEVTMKEKQDTGIDVKPGDRVLACPHPTQKWRCRPDTGWTTFDGRTDRGDHDGLGDMMIRIINPANAERVEIKHDVLIRCPIEGRLYIESRWTQPTGEGTIECKVFKVGAR